MQCEHQHRGGVFWLTGLSAAGKTTLACEASRLLRAEGWMTAVLDGDVLRGGLCADLGFSPQDRAENIRRVGHVAHLMASNGLVVLAAFIAPYQADRDRVRAIVPSSFHEIWVATSLEECERRDPKGLYQRARAGQIPDFTGVSAPYEPPVAPDYVVRTENRAVDQSAAELVRYIQAALAP